jgi:hypothetical protein
MAGIRYGLRHDLELTAGGFYEAPASVTNSGTTVGTEVTARFSTAGEVDRPA